MSDFFKEEAVYITLAVFIFLIAIFITTRPFISKKSRKSLPYIFGFLVVLLLIHYSFVVDNIKSVKEAYAKGISVVCLEKTIKNIPRVYVGTDTKWELIGDNFYHPTLRDGVPLNVRSCIVDPDAKVKE